LAEDESAGILASHLRKPATSALTAPTPHTRREQQEKLKAVASSRKRRAGAMIDFSLPPVKLISKFVAIPSHGPSNAYNFGPSVGDGTARLENGAEMETPAAPNLQSPHLQQLAVGLID